MKESTEPEIHVFQKRGLLFTTSIDVAEKFGKRHDLVIAKIREICDPRITEESALHLQGSITEIRAWFECNFRTTSYLGENGKKLPMYEMTRTGFAILGMGFTGVKAMTWKIKFEQAFSLMEQTLLNQKNQHYIDNRKQGKIARLAETDTIKDFIEYATKQGSTHANYYYKHLTTATYKALFVVNHTFPVSFRDLLNPRQLAYLAAAENVATDAMKDGMAQGLFYKDIFQLAKVKLKKCAELFGITEVIAIERQLSLPMPFTNSRQKYLPGARA